MTLRLILTRHAKSGWDDPDLAIDWPIEIGLEPLVSAKDAVAANFADCEKYE